MSSLWGMTKNIPHRIALYTERSAERRSRKRIHRVACLTCGLRMDVRGSLATAPCDDCIIMLWEAQDKRDEVMAKGVASGWSAFRIPSGRRSHDLAHPALGGNDIGQAPPPSASFDRGQSSPTTLMQRLFEELLDGLHAMSPADTTWSGPSVLPMSGGSNIQPAIRIPTEMAKTILDLWFFVQWLALNRYKAGFDLGHNLLLRMQLGQDTVEAFEKATVEQTKRSQERIGKIEAGERR